MGSLLMTRHDTARIDRWGKRSVRIFFVRLQRFFCVHVSFCLVKRGNRAGSSWNESDYSRRGTQTSFSLLDREFRTTRSSFFNLPARKKSWSNRINRQFSGYTIEKWASPEFSQLRLSRSGKAGLGTSPRVVRLIPRRAGSFSSLYGKNKLESKNISVT